MDSLTAYGWTPEQYFKRRAWLIHRKVQEGATLQVRWHSNAMFTYPYPPRLKHGHGVRGTFVAIYGPGAQREWIESDLLAFWQSLGATTSSEPT